MNGLGLYWITRRVDLISEQIGWLYNPALIRLLVGLPLHCPPNVLWLPCRKSAHDTEPKASYINANIYGRV